MNSKSKILAAYILKLHESNRFDYATTIDGNYQNMGATMIDGIYRLEFPIYQLLNLELKIFLAITQILEQPRSLKNFIKVYRCHN
jgi:hypothetical protein